MQKITLQPGEAVEINGAIIGMEIVDKLLSLQLGIDSPGDEPREKNIGVEEDMGPYGRIILFLSREANYIEDKNELSKWLSCLTSLMDAWNSFRIPGTKKVTLW